MARMSAGRDEQEARKALAPRNKNIIAAKSGRAANSQIVPRSLDCAGRHSLREWKKSACSARDEVFWFIRGCSKI